MATFSTWAALRTAIKDAIANHVANTPLVGSYSIMGYDLKYRTYEELIDLLQKTYDLEALENTGSRDTMTSYSSHRRFG